MDHTRTTPKLRIRKNIFLGVGLCLIFQWTTASSSWAAIPAGGSTATTGLGTGSGTSTSFALERAAPASSVKVSGTPGWIDAPNVTLNPSGDWSIYVATIAPVTTSSSAFSGTVLSIGTASNTLFTDTGHLDITWCQPNNNNPSNPWSYNNTYGNSFVVTGKDDNGIAVSTRVPPYIDAFYGQVVTPLVGQGGFDDGRMHGLVVQRRSGVVEFWSVDDAGPRIMDSGVLGASGSTKSFFGGITNKPLRIGAALLQTQPTTIPTTYWKQPIQSVIVYNGGCMTPVQMERLFRGAHAQDVLSFDPARGDRYYPGTLTNGTTLDELVGGQTGTISGTVTAQPTILPTTVTDDVIVDMDGYGQIIPRDPPPATTTKARFWGTRSGNTTDIQMRVVQWGAPNPITDPTTQVIVPWTTVATAVQNGQTWIGDLPGVPNSSFANYDCEVSWKDGNGNWTAPKRLYREWSLGVVASIAGQSILQKQRDDSGTARSFNSKVVGFLRSNYNMSQYTNGYEDNGMAQGWQTRYTPVAPSTSGTAFGECRMMEQMALLANCPIGIGSYAIGGTPLLPFLDTANGSTDQWLRWKLFIQRNRPQFGVWGNGQGDQGESQATRFSQLDQLLAQFDSAVQTAPGGPWNYMFYVFPCNGDWGGDLDGVRSEDIQWALSRAAMGKPVGIICSLLDEATQDGTHPSDNDAGGGLLASRMAQTFISGAGLAANSGLGPQIDQQSSSWSVSGGVTKVNLVVIPNGGTSIVTEGGGAPSGFYIKVDSGSYVAPASTSIMDATHILITSNTAATSSVTVTYLANGPGNVYNNQSTTKAQAGTDNAVYDNRGDITTLVPGFPMSPITQTNPFVVPQKPAAAAAAPTGLLATPGLGQVALTWTASTNATGYRVYRSTTSGGPYTIINGASGAAATSATTYYDLTAVNGTTYYYVVTAVNGAGESANSAQVSGASSITVPIPSVPTGLAATTGISQVVLSWTASNGATSYNVYRSTTNNGPYTTLVGSPNGTSITDTGLTNGTTYYYVVAAVNSTGASANSTQLAATPNVPPPSPPAVPTGLFAIAGKGQVMLNWTGSAGASSYNIYRSTTNGGPYTTLVGNTSMLSLINTGLTNGTAYYYVVAAVSGNGASANSPQVSATPSSTGAAPVPPSDNTAAPYLGLYTWGLGSPGSNVSASFSAFTASWLNRSTPLWVLEFNQTDNWDDLDSAWWTFDPAASWNEYSPNTPYVFTAGMLPGNGDTPLSGTSLANGAAGLYNNYFTIMAQNLVTAGVANRTIVRLGHEFNGNWYPWSVATDADALNYAAFWRQIVTTMKAVPGASNLKFCWCGATGWAPFDLTHAYPGDDIVDYIGCDIYDQSWATTTYPYPLNDTPADMLVRQKNAWASNAGTANNGMAWFSAFAQSHSKPMCIPEWGVESRADGHAGLDNTYFVQQMYNFIQDPANNVAFHMYFDVNASDGGHQVVQYPGGSPTQFPNSAALFQQLFSAAPLPTNNDIGTVGLAGSETAFIVNGAGAGFLAGGTSDNFHFASEAITGDTMFLAKITSMSLPTTGQSGIMLRQSAAAGDPYAALFIANGHCIFQSRTTAAGAAAQNLVTNSVTAPVWLKLVRAGNVITGYESGDGRNWAFAGAQTVPMTTAALAGIAVSSGNTTTLNATGMQFVNQSSINAVDPGIPSAIIIDPTTTGFAQTGSWATTASTKSYGGSYISTTTTASVTATPTIPITGQYDVYFRAFANYQNGDHIPVTVTSTNGTWSGTINEQLNDQLWIRLGTFNFAAGTSGNFSMNNNNSLAGSWGYMTMDAVMFVPVPVAAQTAPAVPTNLQAVLGNNQVVLSWVASIGATGYNVYRSMSSSGPFALLSTTTDHAYTDIAAVNGATYYYEVSASNTIGTSANSAPTSGTTPSIPVPVPPASVTPTAGNAQVALNWQASPFAASYTIYRATSSTGPFTTILGTSSTFSYTDLTVVNGTTYYYEVSATDSTGTSANSAAVSAKPNLPAPTGLAATGGNAQVVLGWTATTGATSYNIYRSTVSTGPFTAILANSTTNAYTDTAVANGTTYYYEISALGSGGASPNSAAVSATPSLPVPTGLMATGSNAQVVLGWTVTAGATSYNVYRSTTSTGPFTTVLANPTTNAYTDTAVTNGTTYYYEIAAVSSGGTSANSAAVSVTPNLAIPSVPTGLTASSSNAQVVLGWTATAGATSYNVYRATASGGPFTTILASPTTNSYTDTAVVNGTIYYYEIAARNSAGTSANLAPAVSAAPPGLLSGWTDVDVGGPSPVGSGSTTSGGTFTLTAGGVDIFGAADQFNYAYLPLSGNGTITARVVSITGGGGDVNTKGGVMIRETLTGTSTHASEFLAAGAVIQTLDRTTTGGSGTDAASFSGHAAPCWVRMVRNGTSFTGYYSTNGTTWTTTTTMTISMATNVYIGLAVCSHVTGTLCTVTFDNVSVTSTVAVPSVPVGLTATGGNAQVVLGWTASTGATSYNVYRATSSSGPFTTILASPTTNAYTDATAANGTTYYYEVAAVNSGGASANCAAVSATPNLITPAAPTGLTATAGDTQISLSWTASTGATSYKVYRSQVSGGPYGTPVTVTTTSYNDTTTANGTTYYYVVTAVNGGGASANSTQVSATPFSTALPSGWTDADIGTPGATGSATYTNGVFTVKGSGGNITGVSDDFNFASQQVTGNCILVARVTSVQATDPAADAGVMIRETLVNTSSEASIYMTPSSGVAYINRPTDGGSGVAATAKTGVTAPYWLKVARSGNTLTCSYAPDVSGAPGTWTSAGSVTISTLGSSAYVGLGVCSFVSGTLCTATFDNVTLTTVPSVPVGLSAALVANQAALSWTATSGATSYNVYRSTSSSGPFTTTLASPTTNSYTDTTVASGTTYYYEIAASNSSGTSANSASPVSVTTTASVPIGMTAIGGASQVSVSWTASTGATSYNVKRSTTNGGPYTILSSPTTATFSDLTAANGTTYYYVVSAVDAGGESANSSQVSAMPTVPAPAAPLGVAVTTVNGQASLLWTASTGATSYNVKRSTTSGGPYTTVGNPTTISYTDITAAGGSLYYYVVSAVNGGGESANSSQVSITTLLTVAQWMTANNLTGSPTDTPQNDGVSNLLKYLYDINPSRPMNALDRAALPTVSMVTISGKQYLTLTYRQNALMTNVTINVQTCSGLQTWNTVTPDISQQTGTDSNTGDPIMKVGVDITGTTRKFIQLNVTSP